MSMLQPSFSSPSSFLIPGQNSPKTALTSDHIQVSTPNGGAPGDSTADTSPVREKSISNNNNNNNRELTCADQNGNTNCDSELNVRKGGRRRQVRPGVLNTVASDGLPGFLGPAPLVPLVCQYPPRGIFSFLSHGPYFVSLKKPEKCISK